MDKRTLFAVVGSVVIIIAGMLLQQVLFPPKPQKVAQPAAQEQTTRQGEQAAPGGQASGNGAKAAAPQAAEAQATQPQAKAGQPGQQPSANPAGIVVPAPDAAADSSQPKTVVRETGVFRLTFSRDGGVLTSVQLKSYKNVDGSLVDMVIPSGTGQYPFDISFGDYQAQWISAPFALKETVDSSKSIFEFSRTFLSATGIPFTLRKTYLFYANEYMMELRVSIVNSVNDAPALGPGEFAYTLSFGPQIGPHFAKLDGRIDYRTYVYYLDGKRKEMKIGQGEAKTLTQPVTWAGIDGKYFAVVAVPDQTAYRVAFDSRKVTEGFDRSTLAFERPLIKSSSSDDLFRFYMGPKKREILSLYNQSDRNAFKIDNLHIDAVVTSAFLIGWLADLLNYLLQFFYLLIPNYGIAIILLTLVTKLIFLPLTFKSSESMARMSSLNPKIAEIRAKYKSKPDIMNQQIQELYKKEKVNPLSGCLPLLLQIPIFFALYNLLQNNFELRGAMFITGWIPDLSVPESVWNFAPFSIPLLGWQNLRILPFLMLATQFLTTKFTTPPDASQAQSAGQMKLMNYLLPAVFFFILYDMPSGLVVYWTVQNVLSIFQQLYINHVNKRKKELASVKAEVVNTRRR